MNHKTTRRWAAILAAVLALSILLTACGTSGTTPTGDNSTPGVTETPGNTPGTTDPTPDTTTEPGNTTQPDPTPGKTYDEPVVLLPDPENINEEELAAINRSFTGGASSGAEALDNMLDEAYEKYGQYLNENISKLCVKVGLYSIIPLSESEAPITPDALKKVNDLLEANGEEPLELKAPEQKIAAIWLAASLYYDPDFIDPWVPEEKYARRFDIGQAFVLIKYSEDMDTYRYLYCNGYADLFNIH